jgi:acetyl-CoA C-acetyltransferase
MNNDPTRIPVIIGVGQINDRVCNLDSLGLMRAALEKADADAGDGWIAALDSISVVSQISFPHLGNCAEQLVDHFGIAPAHIEQSPYPTGESPVLFLNEAANRIGAGETHVAAICGCRSAAHGRAACPRHTG